MGTASKVTCQWNMILGPQLRFVIKGQYRARHHFIKKKVFTGVYFSIETQLYFIKRLNSVVNESCVKEVPNVSCSNLIWPHIYQQMSPKISSPVET